MDRNHIHGVFRPDRRGLLGSTPAGGVRHCVDNFLAKCAGNRSRARKALKYIRRAGAEFNDLDSLRALRAEFFDPDERAGVLDDAIRDLERGVQP